MSWTSRWSRSRRCLWRSRRWWRRWAAPPPPTRPSWPLPRIPSSYFLSRFSFATKKSSDWEAPQRSTYCHLLNTDHYMFHSINRDNEHNFLQMLLKRYFEVKSTNIHLNRIPDLKMQSICLWNILPEVGRVLVEAYYRVAWASGWIGQEFSIMQPVLQNLFKPEVGTATVCYLPIEGPRKWNTISRGLKSL